MQYQTVKMATISRGQGRLTSNSQTGCHLTVAMSLPSFVGISRIDLEKSAKNSISNHKNGRHLPKSTRFEVKFTNKASLTPSNIPTKLCWNNQNRFGEKCKNVIFLFKMAAILLNLQQLASRGGGFKPIKHIYVPHFMWDLIKTIKHAKHVTNCKKVCLQRFLPHPLKY